MWIRQNVDGPHTWYKRRIFPQDSRARLAYAPDYPQGIPAEQAHGLLQAIEEGWGKGVAFEALPGRGLRVRQAQVKCWYRAPLWICLLGPAFVLKTEVAIR